MGTENLIEIQVRRNQKVLSHSSWDLALEEQVIRRDGLERVNSPELET